MDNLRQEIAAAAARLVVEDGLDYASAKRRATHQLLGPGRHRQPDNADVLAEVKRYLELFGGDDHPQLLRRLRRTALRLMEDLAAFRPHLAGAVWNGSATAHSAIHLLLFCDDSKEVEIAMIDRGLHYQVGSTPHYAGRGQVDTLSLDWPLEGDDADGGDAPAWVEATLALYPAGDERGVLASGERGSLAALRRLLAGSESAS